MKRKKYSLPQMLFLTFFLAVLALVLLRYFTSIFISLFLVLLCYSIFMWVYAIRKGELVEATISKGIKPITKQRLTKRATVGYSVEFEYGGNLRSKVKAKKVFSFRKNAEKFIGQGHVPAYYFSFGKGEQIVIKEGLVRNILLVSFIVIPILIYLVIFFFPYTIDTISGIIDFFG